MLRHPIILAIESSCDDTSAAVMAAGEIKSNIIANQSIHEKYGGVVPEVASRAHEQVIIPVIREALVKAGCNINQIDAIACTRGPGLLGSLLVGLSVAKGISLARRIPLIEVNHMKAHILAHFIDDPKPAFPFLCLTVSGGHTQIVLVEDTDKMTELGATLDDAAGEAFDKTGKIIGLPYPAGPHIDKLAGSGKAVFAFPVSKLPEYNFSFSGLKTSILYFLKKQTELDPGFIEKNKADICASVQKTIIETLMHQLVKASEDYHIKNIAIAGGVSANSGLRNALEQEALTRGWNHFIPKFEYCTDNAAMIAMAAHFQFLKGNFADLESPAVARMPINPLS